jgi:DNA mismatch repair protein MutS2
LRRALEEERAAVAEKYSTLERDAERRERERQSNFEREMRERLTEFEGRSRELFSKIEDRAERIRVEREAATRAAELRREAQRAAAATTSARPAASKAGNTGETGQTGGVRVVRQARAALESPRAKSGGETFQPASVEREIVKGDTVRLTTLGKTGVVERVSGGDAEVRIGHVRLREKLTNLELMERAPQPQGKQTQPRGSQLEQMAAASARTADVRLTRSQDEPASELNLIGRTTDEAVDAADKFLDAAYLNGLARVRIIHGHGTGALRRAIADFLRSHAHVETFAPAPPDQGGAGATVVELKQ